MKLKELFDTLEIWTTNEEAKILKKLEYPIKLSTLNEHDRIKVEYMVKKGLVNKTGFNNPTVVANENFKKDN